MRRAEVSLLVVVLVDTKNLDRRGEVTVLELGEGYPERHWRSFDPQASPPGECVSFMGYIRP